jgi:outer membrane biosynthesis protein TonB
MRQNPIQNVAISCVIFLHVAFVLILLIAPPFSIHKKQRKPLVVKTVTPQPKMQTKALEKKSLPAAPAPKPKPLPQQPKKETVPSPTVKKELPKPAPPAVKKEPAIAERTPAKPKPPTHTKQPPPQQRAKISDSLLQQLEESIAKIEQTPSSKKVLEPTVSPIRLRIDQNEAEDADQDYINSLVSYLHQSLSLPDYGEVKIQLSLRQDGTVAKMVILKTQSEKNRQYLESRLSNLRFPRFDGMYANKKEQTFILTFCNE